MTTKQVSDVTTKYIKQVFADLGTKNTIEIEELHAGKPWYSSPDHWNFRAAAKATETVYVRCRQEIANDSTSNLI